MPTNKPRKTSFPSDQEILDFIETASGRVDKRQIARAFKLDAEQKKQLKKILRQFILDGKIQKSHGKKVHSASTLPEVTVLRITKIDDDGDLQAIPDNWPDHEQADNPPPRIYMDPEKPGQPALRPGDHILARLRREGKGSYRAKTIRKLGHSASSVLGIYSLVNDQGRIQPVDKKLRSEFLVDPMDALDARSGDLVRAEILSRRRHGLRLAKIIEKFGTFGETQTISLISIIENDLPHVFSDQALDEAEAAKAAPLESRVDLRKIPLVTIDGADAKDFDDAVWAEVDPDNPEGWRIIVAIADVSWYVRPESRLDKEAYERGNSVYFPDRVVPMLPEALSNGWCSLVPDEDRPCLAADMRIDRDGRIKNHRFFRGLMRSCARLTYEQVQQARDGNPDEHTAPLMASVITLLYGAYHALSRWRKDRHALELDIPEKRIVMDTDGKVSDILERDRLESHQLIEEFMIAANVAAAETLESRKQPCMYRVHDQPGMDKIEALSQFLQGLGLNFAKGQVVKPIQFNQILKKSLNTPASHMISQMILRSQSQAEYSPNNIGHFGLALSRYCHFTSPIRRYADLLVHRALVAGLGLGEGGDIPKQYEFVEMGEHLSKTERRAVTAERNAIDRFCALFLEDRIGQLFPARINAVTRFGLFVTLDKTGADGLVSLRSMADDYYDFDEQNYRLEGRGTGRVFTLGQRVMVKLLEANPITGGMLFEIAAEDGSDQTQTPFKRKFQKRSKSGKKPTKKHRKKQARSGSDKHK